MSDRDTANYGFDVSDELVRIAVFCGELDS